MDQANVQLTERQRQILRRLVEQYIATGEPVGSRTLVERAGVRASSSTVRSELSEMESLGLLTHPHTSAGRVPTDSGVRLFVSELLDRLESKPAPFPLDLAAAEREVEAALQATTEMLSEVTRLLALVSAPSPRAASVRHVEVLLLQPQIAMVVVITSAGAVTKGVYSFDEAVDPGLAAWARQYLNETLVGRQLSVRLLRQRFDEPSLGESERAFLASVRPTFTELLEPEQQSLFVGGAAGLLGTVRPDELGSYQQLLETLERRAALVELLDQARDPRRPFVRVGVELDHPGLQRLSLVGAAYGVAHRTLGAVSLLGPVRMDYEKAIRSVRGAAHELSRFVEAFYEDN
jgi:heat-inducible transcriptional repressor